MDIQVNVANQKLKIATNLKSLVAGTQEFVRFVFNLTGDWDNLLTFAQFRQNGVAYNQYLDENNSAFLPSEIGTGTCTLMLYGSNSNTIATTNYLTLTIDDNILVTNANSTEISTSLYNQLVSRVNALTSFNEQGLADLIAVDTDLQAQINTKATSSALTAEISRATAAEQANATAIATKASQAQVDELEIAVSQLESNEVIAGLIEDAVEAEIEDYLQGGQLANMTIADSSIARTKVNSAFETTLSKADSAMQPSVYDPQNLRVDIFSYAQARADIVQNRLNTLITEIQGGYRLSDTAIYTNIGDAIRGAVTLSRNYAQALLANYEPFNVSIVSVLPTVGTARTFYLIPKASGNGYDKYWYITDGNGTGAWDCFGASSTQVVNELPTVGETDVDYILKTSSGCLYYKYINGIWNVVAGSLAYVSSTLPTTANGNEYTDYYIVDSESGSYVHYRFINGSYKVIGGDSYTKDEIDTMLSQISDSITANTTSIQQVSARVTSNTTNIASLNRSLENLQDDFDDLDVEGYTYYHTITTSGNNYILSLHQVKDSEDTIVSSTQLPATGGGGGGTSTTTTVTVDRVTESPLVLTTTDSAIIQIDFSSVDTDNETYDATYTWKNGNTILMTGSLVQGVNKFDLSDFVSIGTQKFTLTVVDEMGTTVVKSWTIQKVDIRIETNFNDRYTNPVGNAVSFTYTPYGAVSKTVHFKLDGVETTTTTSASGTLQSYTIPAQTHGSHLLEVWITATVNNTTVETNHIFKDIIWYNDVATSGVYQSPVIGCIYRFDHYGNVSARQYDTTSITYNVYNPATTSPVVKRYVDGTLISTDTLTTNQNVWNYKSDVVGTHTLRIECGVTSVTIKVAVTTLGIDVTPITGNLKLDFNPTGITNSSNNRIWSNADYAMTVSNNFDWANGGYKIDENGDTYFLIKAGTTATFDYEMFAGGLNNNPSINGAEMKIVFMTENVQDKDAVWFSNVETITTTADNVTTTTKMGIQMGVHEGWLKTNNASDTDVDTEDESIAATNTYLYMPYSEEDIIEMDININTIDRDDSNAKAFIMSYEDGVPSKAYVYDSSDRLYQYTPQPIIIGSEYCDVRIYRMKIYATSLTTENIMKNFIADSRDSTTMLNRYDRNSIYYNSETGDYTPYSSEGVLNPERLAAIVPNCKILMLETDHFTTSKKTFVKSKLRCIHATGGDVYSGDPYYDNWYFENGYHSGQGTTSDNYGNAGRNVDFLFNCDGVHKPCDKVNPEAGYVSSVTLGYNTENAHTETVTDWMGSAGKVTLTRTSIPNNFFNLKVNIASSENVNNALLQKRYNDYLPYISPAKRRNAFTKNDMEFVPAILFIKETNEDISTHNEFLDTNWHFYALGNIGDSKKTDYTRAYDPEDMNEFTIEISDNTKNNATFQTGVYMNGNNRVVETVGDTDIHTYVYPITVAEWTSANNKYHSLYNEAFDGDHSFEPRYACCGDYRDGKIVNDTHNGADPAQIVKNADVWRAFYRWVITSTNEQFTSELDQWCVRSAVEFFYAFTHMYTMMDNRAKNTFWHFAKTGTYRAVSRPVSELLHIYCEKSTVNGVDTYTTTTDTSIDANKTYYTQYAFDLMDYDNDTALGINNNGELIFPYGKEDTDYNIEGSSSSGYVFNGATSVFWCRLRDLLASEIKNTFASVVASECFSATHLINQFDQYQECYPEEIWRLDIERKYIRTFTGLSVDNSKPKSDVQYLRDMMQGRKKYQRRQWIRDQEIYFGTKNLMNTVVGDDNRITFRCFTPTGNDVVVEPDYTLSITPYSDMYVSVMFGNGDVRQVRAKGGTAYTIECPLATMDDTQVTIYGANRIQALNDLSACYIAANNFSMATKLRKLVLGNTTNGYKNTRLISLTLGNNKLLEELDLRNCSNLTGTINLSQCSNLLKLYAEGTGITGVTFATNGKIQIAHLPNTINTLTMRNLNDMTDFQATLSNLESLTLEGGNLDNQDIVSDCIDTLRVLYLYGINWTGNDSLSDTTLLNSIKSLFYSLITGSVYISGQVRQQELNSYANAWSDLTVTYNDNNLVPQSLVTYVNADDNNTVLYSTYVDRGSLPPDPYALGLIPKPTLASTAQYSYSFGTEEGGTYVSGSGWDDITDVVLTDRTITAVYTSTIRSYTVTWYSREGLSLGSTTANYGSEVIYTGQIPTNTSEENTYIYNVFAGWNKSTGFIKENTDVYAIWERAPLPSTSKTLDEMSAGEIFAVATSGNAANYFDVKDYTDIELGHDFSFTNVESRTLVGNSGSISTTALELDGETAYDTNIVLFGENSPSFTMAIDFRFTGTSTNNTLVACYDDDGQEGFRLRYNSKPNLQWGDRTVDVGYSKYRDIVVLRHKKGDNKLYVYNSNAADANFSNAVSTYEITRSRATETEQILTLGAIRFVSDGGYDDYGTGYIYWAKVWLDDLGDANAKQLAAWTHEVLRMEYYGNQRYRLSGGTSQKSNMSFISNACLVDRLKFMNSTNTNTGGWDGSAMRTFMNNRLPDALPTVWRSMLKRVKISATAGNQSTSMLVSDDYFYLPCYNELSGANSTTYVDEGSYITWFTSNIRRAKFRGMIIPEDASYYTTSADPSTISTNDVSPGDVWQPNGGSNRCYIYATNAQIDYYGLSKTDSQVCSLGGYWISAYYWWERSPYLGYSTGFWYVNNGGNNYYGYGSASTTYGVCPCFSI